MKPRGCAWGIWEAKFLNGSLPIISSSCSFSASDARSVVNCKLINGRRIDMPMLRAHVYIHGRVQGVFFRASTRDEAKALCVNGWVKNCSNGSVEAIFEGEKNTVDKIVNWCKKGPAGAYVERVDVGWEKYLGEFNEFTIVY